MVYGKRSALVSLMLAPSSAQMFLFSYVVWPMKFLSSSSVRMVADRASPAMTQDLVVGSSRARTLSVGTAVGAGETVGFVVQVGDALGTLVGTGVGHLHAFACSTATTLMTAARSPTESISSEVLSALPPSLFTLDRSSEHREPAWKKARSVTRSQRASSPAKQGFDWR